MSVSGEYQVRPPMRPTHFFLIDVSQPAVSSGATAAVCSSVAKILDELPGGERTQVGGAWGRVRVCVGGCDGCGLVGCMWPVPHSGGVCEDRWGAGPQRPLPPHLTLRSSLPPPAPTTAHTASHAPAHAFHPTLPCRCAWPPLTPPSTSTRCAPARPSPTCWWSQTSQTCTAPWLGTWWST